MAQKIKTYCRNIKSEILALDVGASALRKFGLLIGGILLFVALIIGRNGITSGAEALLFVALILLLTGVLYPRALRLTYYFWMGFALMLGSVVSTILLTVLFYLLLTPLALLARLFKKKEDLSVTDSYFVKREKEFVPADMEQLF